MDLLAESRKQDKPSYSFTECVDTTNQMEKEEIEEKVPPKPNSFSFSSVEDMPTEEPSSTEYSFTPAYTVEVTPVDLDPLSVVMPPMSMEIPTKVSEVQAMTPIGDYSVSDSTSVNVSVKSPIKTLTDISSTTIKAPVETATEASVKPLEILVKTPTDISSLSVPTPEIPLQDPSDTPNETPAEVPMEVSTSQPDRNDSLIPEPGTDLSDNETKELLHVLDMAIEVSRTESTNLDSDSDSSLHGVSLTPVKRPLLPVRTVSFSPLQKPGVEATSLDETAIVSVDQSSYLKSVFTSACDSLVEDEEDTSEEKDERVVSARDVDACAQGVMSESEESIVVSEEESDPVKCEGAESREVVESMNSERETGSEKHGNDSSEESNLTNDESGEQINEELVSEEQPTSEESSEESTNKDSSSEQSDDLIDSIQIVSGPVSPNESESSFEEHPEKSIENTKDLDYSSEDKAFSYLPRDSDPMEEDSLSSNSVVELSSDSDSHPVLFHDPNQTSPETSTVSSTLHQPSLLPPGESINERISPQRVASAIASLSSPTMTKRPWTEVNEESRETEIVKRLREGTLRLLDS